MVIIFCMTRRPIDDKMEYTPAGNGRGAMKIGLCGNFNLDAVAEALDARFGQNEIIVGRDGAFHQELSAPFGEFASLDMCIIALDWRELTPLLYGYARGDDAAAVTREFTAQCERIKKSIESLRSARTLPVLVFSPLSDHCCPAGFIDRLLDPSQFGLFSHCQGIYNGLCRGLADVYPVDIEEIGGRIGKERAFDPVSGARAHRPFSAAMTGAVADRIHATSVQLRSYPLKCIVLDLDNTLWGGAIGEDGFGNIELGTAGRPRAYRDFQQELLKLYKQGTLLAVCSKNNTCDALDAIERHPHMVIRPDMISCYRINWEDKPKNVVEIAAELNIGLDAIMFVDDSPVERAIMRAALPGVTVLELPDEPELFADALRACTRFWPVQLTESDLARAGHFRHDKARAGLQKMSLNKTEYLKGLDIVVTIAPAAGASMERAAQLFNKTNQFNLTAARYTRGALERIAGLAGNRLFCMEMSDRFEAYGIIGVALVCGNTIESFALSCRAFGRQIELAFLAHLLAHLRHQGHEAAVGRFVPAPRNAMAKDFFKDAGFTLSQESAAGSQWVFDFQKPLPQVPPWIRVT
jgi:FkbH-like protein